MELYIMFWAEHRWRSRGVSAERRKKKKAELFLLASQNAKSPLWMVAVSEIWNTMSYCDTWSLFFVSSNKVLEVEATLELSTVLKSLKGYGKRRGVTLLQWCIFCRGCWCSAVFVKCSYSTSFLNCFGLHCNMLAILYLTLGVNAMLSLLLSRC